MLRYVLLTSVLLQGCAVNQASFSLRDPELFVSPNKHHVIQLDRTLYYFEYKVDSGLDKWIPRPSKRKPLFELDGLERSSVPDL